MALTWKFEIDWDDDTVYTDEAGKASDFQSWRGRSEYISPSGNGINPVGLGQCSFVLDNQDGRYDAWNTSSALYPDVEPGKFVKVSVASTATYYEVFAGEIIDIIPSSVNRNETVTVLCADGYRRLVDNDSTTILYANITTDTAMGHVLTDANYPAAWGTALDSGLDTIPYWWGTGEKVHRQIADLVDSELGTFFIAADGKATFHNRHKVLTSAYTITQAELLTDVSLPQPWDNVRNIVNIVVNPRTIPDTGLEIYRLYDIPLVAAGAAITIWARYKYNYTDVPADNVIDPLVTTDYTMNTQSGGGGADASGDFTVVMTDFGDTAKLVITNNGAVPAYITMLNLRGDPITQPYQSKAVAEKAEYATKPRVLTLDLPWQQQFNIGQDFANFLASALANPEPYPVIKIEDRATYQFTVDLFDLITLQIAAKGISDDFRIGRIEHRWLTSNGQSVVTKFYLEQYSGLSGYWRFTTQIGVSSIFGW